MKKTLKLVLTNHWFSQIESGRKKHEYREYKEFWIKRLYPLEQWGYVEFQKGYQKNPKKILYEIKNIKLEDNGWDTDLKINQKVFDITLGEKLSK